MDNKVEKLVNKKAETLRDPDISLKRKVETEKYFQYLNAEWLSYIHGETNMTDQQNQTVQLTSDAEPTAANNSQSVVGVSQRTVENGNPNKDNGSKASSDKRAKKAEKHAALERDFAAKMRLKKIEFELNTRKKLSTQEHQILMKVQPLLFEVDHHSIGKPRSRKMFPGGSITRTKSPTCTIIVSSVQKPGSTTIIPG